MEKSNLLKLINKHDKGINSESQVKSVFPIGDDIKVSYSPRSTQINCTLHDIYKELSDQKYDKYTFGVKQIKVSTSGVINIKWEC